MTGSPAPAFSSRYRAFMLALLVATYACSFVDRIIVSVVGHAMIRELGLSDLQFGLLGGMAFAIFYTAFGIPLARLAETRNRVNLLSACIALWSAMTMLCGAAQSYWQLLLFRMGVGVGEAGCSPGAHSLISDHYPPQQRASALGVYTIGVPLGVMLGSVAGGWLAETFSWRTALLVVGAPGLLLALLLRVTLREPPRGHAEGAADRSAPPLGEVLRALLGTPGFRHVATGLALSTLVANSVSLFAPVYFARRFGLGMAEVGLLYGLVSGSAGVAGMLAGGFGTTLAVKRDARFYAWGPALGALLAAPLYALAYSRTSLELALGLVFLGWICASLPIAPTFAVAQNLVEPRARASAAALLLLVMNLAGQGLGPLVIGTASDVLAGGSFAGGDYASSCLAGGVAPALAADCAQASAAGLQQSILVVTVVFLWSALHYLLASRSIAAELRCATSGAGNR